MGPRRTEQEEAINECRVLAKLDSQYVVKYYESFIDAGGETLLPYHSPPLSFPPSDPPPTASIA